MYAEFRADSCIGVSNEVELKSRLSTALKKRDWGGLLGAVKYFDLQELGAITNNEDILFSKSNQYAWQQEFRAVVFTFFKKEMKEQRVTIDIGDLSDIARFA